MKIQFNYAAISDIGMVRKNNEDNFCLPDAPVREPKVNIYKKQGSMVSNKAFFCVCDGMGGHSAGEVASYIAASNTSKNYERIIDSVTNKKQIKNTFRAFVSDTNDAIYNTACENSSFASMGTTMSGVCFFREKAYFVNIGDSRVYMLKGNKLSQLTVDHADPENTHALTRFLGMSSVYGKVFPDVAVDGKKIGYGSRFLLCTDGLTDMVSEEKIRDVLIECKKPEDAVDHLVEEAKKRGGRDNITAIVIDAQPVAKAVKILTSKVTIAILCIALLAGGAAYYYLNYMKHTTGASLTEISQNIKNAENLKDAMDGYGIYFNTIENEIKKCEDYASTVNESDADVKGKNDALKQAIEKLKTSYAGLHKAYDDIIAQKDISDEERLNQIKAMANLDAYVNCQNGMTECENNLKAVGDAVDMYNKRQEEINKAQNRNTNTQNNNSSSNNSPKRSSSSGNSGSSGNSTPSENSGNRSSSGNSGSSENGGSSSQNSGNNNSSNNQTGSSNSTEKSDPGDPFLKNQ